MILDSNNMLWDKYIEALPGEKQDIYFTRRYGQESQLLGGGEAQLFLYEEGDNFGIYPYIKHMVNLSEDKCLYYDIETPYGYGGPLVKNKDLAFIHKFEKEFLKYCLRENIIAEFIRFHPLLRNEGIFQKNIDVLHNRTTAWLDLERSLDEIWMHDISTQNRNTIRKCRKNGLSVEISEDYDAFSDIYNQTMCKVGAERFYFFDQAYYDKMKHNPDYKLMHVVKDKEILAAAIFMKYGEYFHYHLAGSKYEFLKYAPNNILLWEAIKYAKSCGCKKMHFGGGRSVAKDDSLLQFKRRFSSQCTDFYIGKRIHNERVYGRLIKEWENTHGEKAKILLQYRE